MMIRIDKKSSKSYENAVKFCHLSSSAASLSYPGQPVESKNRVRDCFVPVVYIAENAEWIAEELSLVLRQQLSYQMIPTQTRTFEY